MTPAPLPALAYDTIPAGGTRWCAETKAVVAAAAVVSFVSLLYWGGTLWASLQPSTVRGRLFLPPWPSIDFARFVLQGVLHVAVVAGALAALVSQKVARRVLLAAALGVLALAVYQFATFSMFQPGLTRPREGPDWIYGVADDGARLVVTQLVHGLLVLTLSRTASPAAAGWSPVTQLIVAAAAIGALMHLTQEAAITWVGLQPSLFKEVGRDPLTVYGLTIVSARVVLNLALLLGAALALFRGRHQAGRRLLLVGAAGLLGLTVYGNVKFLVAPPPGMSRSEGPALIVNTIYHIGRIITLGMIHVLVIFSMTRRHVRDGAATPGKP